MSNEIHVFNNIIKIHFKKNHRVSIFKENFQGEKIIQEKAPIFLIYIDERIPVCLLSGTEFLLLVFYENLGYFAFILRNGSSTANCNLSLPIRVRGQIFAMHIQYLQTFQQTLGFTALCHIIFSISFLPLLLLSLLFTCKVSRG